MIMKSLQVLVILLCLTTIFTRRTWKAKSRLIDWNEIFKGTETTKATLILIKRNDTFTQADCSNIKRIIDPIFNAWKAGCVLECPNKLTKIKSDVLDCIDNSIKIKVGELRPAPLDHVFATCMGEKSKWFNQVKC